MNFSLAKQAVASVFHRLGRSQSSSYSTWTYPTTVNSTTPQFIVTPNNGFLPHSDPLERLPDDFHHLESLLQKMPLQIKTDSGSYKEGLLSEGNFGETLVKELPVYDVANITDSALLMALFRDYTFAASAYLLEPCDLGNRISGNFGIGRDHLPASIAVPLVKIANKIGAKPFMEYAQSYALYNYRRKDKSKPVTYDNLELIRQFSGLPSESGFILVHVDMVAKTKGVVEHVIGSLNAVAVNDRLNFNKHLRELVTVMKEINGCMEKMWKRSSPSDYLKFRTFILGTKNQMSIFPKGVEYRGTDLDGPQFFRGESGANDSIIPTIDNFLELTKKMPKNEMTNILKDFRSYRPLDHSNWLKWVEDSASELGIEKYAKLSTDSLQLYIMLLDEVRDFRTRHWNFAKEYIIKRTAYPTATGGSPMASWLPNQLYAVLRMLQDKSLVYRMMMEKEDPKLDEFVTKEYYNKISDQLQSLRKDMLSMEDIYGRYRK